MLTRTIEHAVNNTIGPRADTANESLSLGIHTLNAQAVMARQELVNQIEFATYVIAAAILTGFVILAVAARTGS
jgi:hypothetical protein